MEEPQQNAQMEEVVEYNEDLNYQQYDQQEVKPTLKVNNIVYPTYSRGYVYPQQIVSGYVYRTLYYNPYTKQYYFKKE
jgi:hypothetical protein